MNGIMILACGVALLLTLYLVVALLMPEKFS